MIIAFYGALICLFIYRLFLLIILLRKNESGENPPTEGISLIICARNERKNLEQNIPHWLAQSHPSREIIIVDDGSRDRTQELLQKHPEIKGIRIDPGEKEKAGKKRALALGIAVANHEVIAVTDADCMPASEEWLLDMHRSLPDSAELVLGYAPLRGERTLLGYFQRFEAWITGLRSLGMAKMGRPYMGVGRNMVYRRTLYASIKSDPAYHKGIGGDDDLLVNRSRTDAAVNLQPQCFTYTDSCSSWRKFFKRKRRHISASKYYRAVDKMWLLLLGILPVFIIVLGLVLALQGLWKTAVLGVLMYWLLQWPAVAVLMKKMEESDLIPIFPLLELAYWLYLVIMAPVSLLKSPDEW